MSYECRTEKEGVRDVRMGKEVDISENAKKVLEKRYLKKDKNGTIEETPAELFERVARAIAQADAVFNERADVEKTAGEFFSVMARFDFLPNSPTLMNAGKDLGQLSACFVLPIEDSMESIFETIKDTALIHKSGGGTGFSFSRLRAQNSVVRSTGGIASGPISFMKVFDAATQAVKQGGTRRGANMGILRVDHPDIMEFIQCKSRDKEISNFNISVALTEEFMKRVEDDEEYDLIEPRTSKPVGKLRAREVFDLITERAHKNGEPGIIFLDRINAANPTPLQGEVESTNPCGEQPLLPYESCNLGSVNVSTMVKDGQVDWPHLKRVVHTAVHFLDNVIEVNKFPLKKIEDMTKRNRKIGLGVMGFADLLIQLGVAYNSEEGIMIGEQVMSFVEQEAVAASEELARTRGTFPSYKESIYNAPGKPRLRNATLTTIAPTGTLSILAGVSSGIEPLFAISFFRRVLDNQKLVEVNPHFERIARERGFYSEALMKKIAEKGCLKDITEVPEDVRRIFVTAHEISPKWHVRMQAAFQKFTHNAVSKTINFSHEASIEDVKQAYQYAYTLGCKGITIYRDGSREEQVLNIPSQESRPKEKEPVLSGKIAPRPRPVVMRGTTTKITTGCGNLYVTINADDNDQPVEVFMQMGKAGGCAASQLEAIGRLVSMALRSGVEVAPIVEQLRGIRCPSPSWEKGGGRIFSCSDAIARVIERRLQEDVKDQQGTEQASAEPVNETVLQEPVVVKKGTKAGNIVGVCPDCGGALRHEEGCMICRACAYSKCG